MRVPMWGRGREARREVAERQEAGQAVGPDPAADLKVDGRPADD